VWWWCGWWLGIVWGCCLGSSCDGVGGWCGGWEIVVNGGGGCLRCVAGSIC